MAIKQTLDSCGPSTKGTSLVLSRATGSSKLSTSSATVGPMAGAAAGFQKLEMARVPVPMSYSIQQPSGDTLSMVDFQAEETLVESAGTLLVCDRIGGEGDFIDLDHGQL
jgi:hypothetical protein